ncbi:MAG: CHAD domain-containing protein [Thiobacillaceae bacterium]|nr:CHAD domain-containing protein [Thiobacillaceae bacterium]
MEIELKLALAGDQATRFRRLAELRVARPTRHKLYSVYLDTSGFDLLGRGIALRLRRVGFHWVQTLKARAGTGGLLAQRPEWEVQVTGNRPDLSVLPEEACGLVPVDLRDALVPAFETEFTRAAWLLRHGESQIEVALDQGTIRAGGRELPISEVELELKSGRLADLFDLAEGWLDGLPFQLEPRSKAQRGYQLAGALPLAPVKAGALALSPDMPATAAFAAIARACVDQFDANLPGLLRGTPGQIDTEYLHQMRVSMRRLRAIVGLLRHAGLPPPAWVGELKWLMGELSPARDWDVFVDETLPRLRAVLPDGQRLDALAPAVAAARQDAQERARQAVGSTRLVKLWLAVERDLASLAGEGMDAAAWAHAALRRRHRQLRRLGRHFDRLSAPERHAVRIAAKKLRYAADAFASLYGARAARYIGRLAALQDELGLANDRAVAARLLGEPKLDADGTRAAGLVEGYLCGEALAHEAALARGWRELIRSRPFW